ncbi:hypothetical protein IF2G_03277 [Cordyceps javanica]|nr:hypothetical protein IF2G_03277 [Cordyceps javanica]
MAMPACCGQYCIGIRGNTEVKWGEVSGEAALYQVDRRRPRGINVLVRGMP